ncbi:MAG: TetR/AcrR family transcriptional regulator [Gammaproteobacteria bacterium]|nr:TetR/AcrR family transcriptional regulator [Gammaproteobacteria bacterium]
MAVKMPQPSSDKRSKSRRSAPRERVARADREQQMLEQAARIFGEQGYNAASMTRIAEAVGVTKPMLYAYFGSKEGLYLAVVDRAGTHMIASMESLLVEPDPAQRLRLGAQYLLGYIARHRDSWAVLFAEGVAGATVAARVRRYRERIVDMIAMTLAGLAPGRREIEARPYALALIGAGEAITNWWVNQNEVSLNAMSTAVSDIVEAVSKAYVAGAAPVAERRTRRAR